MGEFLTTPIKDKFSEDGENEFLRFGCSFMQGWRKRMEDAHIMDLDIGPNKNTQLFGVFDGHGGKEVAVYVGRHFTEEFLKNESYLKGDIKSALIENYIKMDKLMLEEPGRTELVKEALLSKEEDAKKQENVHCDYWGIAFLCLWLVFLQIVLDKGNNADVNLIANLIAKI